MPMVPRRVLLASFPVARLPGQARTLRGQWAAEIRGRQIGGTWTTRAHEEPDACAGSWQLLDNNGRVLAGGYWSARKAPDAWNGAWAAERKGGGKLSGTWTARTRLAGHLPLLEMIASAAGKELSGTWRTETGLSGTWTIWTE